MDPEDKTPDEERTDMFPQIGEDPEPEEFLPGYATREEAVSALEAAKREREEFEARQRSWQEQEQRMNSMMERMMALQGQAAAPRDQQSAPAGGVDWDTLPDPVEDVNAFRRELAARINRVVSSQTEAVVSQTRQQQAAADLERRFYQTHTDLADFPEIVRTATQTELQKAATLGLNPAQYVFADPDAFMGKVAENARARVNELRNKFGGGAAQQQPAPSRTGGLSGGSGGQGSRMSNGHDAPGSFVDELKSIQRASGLY